MSEPVAAGEPQEQPEAAAPGRTRTGLGRAGRWVRRRSARWVVVGAAVVVVGAGAAAMAVHHHEHEGHGDGRQWAAGDREQHGGHGDQGGHGGHGGHHGRHGGEGRQGGEDGTQAGDGTQAQGGGRTGKAAPAPLPSADAGTAVTKAAGAVSGGKVESLTTVAQQGGGSAWQAVVLGPDGVRHLVTVDGAGASVTGNTVLDH
ncbi:hypothetical protein ACPC54_20510 [Kitasatospora sp. NPDC094028]